MTTISSYNLSPDDVANWFLCNIDREAGDSITHLKLQKLLYYAQAWSLVLRDKSLFEEDFQAWAHGPVLQTIYDKYKGSGFTALEHCDCDNNINEDAEEVLLDVQQVYGEKSAKFLENLTHSESPWIIARGSLSPEERCNTSITKESMYEFYLQMLNEEEN